MTGLPAYLRRLLDAGADDRVVPPSGFTATLVSLTSAVMSCLAVLALAAGLAAGQLAARWDGALAHSSTVRIAASDGDRAARLETVLRILETTPGVVFARPLDAGEQRALLEPWFGDALDADLLELPQLVEVLEEDAGLDAEGLRLRLAAEVPEAVFEDHGDFRQPLARAASHLRALAFLSVLALALALAGMVALASHGAMAAHAQVISVLRLVGATDGYIARAFERRFALRAVLGSAAGVVVALLALALLPEAPDAGILLAGLGFRGTGWILPLLVPLFAGGVALAATGWSARRVMKGLD